MIFVNVNANALGISYRMLFLIVLVLLYNNDTGWIVQKLFPSWGQNLNYF